MEELIARYGAWAILVGTFLEGETILVLGGYAAARGWLDLPIVILAAFLGSFSGDQLYFAIGRRHGREFLARRARLRARFDGAQALLRRHRYLVICGSRFMYGLRIVLPFAIGMAGIKPTLFVVLNLLGAAVWAVAFGCAGYYLGAAFERLLPELHRYELRGLLALCGAMAALWLVRVVCIQRRRRHPHQPD